MMMWRLTSRTASLAHRIQSSSHNVVRGLFTKPNLLTAGPLSQMLNRRLCDQPAPQKDSEEHKAASSSSMKWVVGGALSLAIVGAGGYLYYDEDVRTKAEAWLRGEDVEKPIPIHNDIPPKTLSAGRTIEEKVATGTQGMEDGENGDQSRKEKAERRAKAREEAEAAITRVQKNYDFEAAADKTLTKISELVDMAIKANRAAIEMCREHASKLKEAMDVSPEQEGAKAWYVEDTKVMEEAHKAYEMAIASILSFKELIEAAKKDDNTRENEKIYVYETQIGKPAAEVKEMHEKLKAEESFLETMKMMRGMQEKNYAAFLKETEAIVPEMKKGEKGLDLSVEQLNDLLAHSSVRCMQLKRQLMEQELLEHQRLEDSLCAQREANMINSSERLVQELEKRQAELKMEKEAEFAAQDLAFEAELKLKLAKQKAEHHENLQEMLALQQKKLEELFDVALSEWTIEEYRHYLSKIEGEMGRIQALEAALEERANLEKVITQIQDVNSSATSLMHAVTKDVDCEGDNYDIIKIDKALKRCYEVAKNNPFVEVILQSIPPKAAERGIYSMSSLEKRFYNVHRQCTKGQLFSFSNPPPKYTDAAEFENPAGMSENELLTQAKYFMDKKCVSEAVRCLVQLDGKVRNLARDWIEEARMVLEVRQAAEVLMAYATSKGLGITL